MVLKKYAAKGYTLHQLGKILYRDAWEEDEPSPIEKVVELAEGMAKMQHKNGITAKFDEITSSPNGKYSNGIMDSTYSMEGKFDGIKD